MSQKDDLISRQDAIDAYGDWYVEEGTEEGFIGTVKQLLEGLPSAQPELAQDLRNACTDAVSRQAAIDEIEYELEMINLALDSITLDFNARERLRQRKGEAREILNSIQQLPSAQPDTYEALRILDTINSSGRLDYGDYCDLHDAISEIGGAQNG